MKRTNKPNKPTPEQFGWYTSRSFEEPSGWMYEEGEERYFKALKKWIRTVKRKRARRVQIMIARSYDLKAQECFYKSKPDAFNTKP